MQDPAREHVALVGLSGSGKSAVAPLVAAALGLVSVDLDELVVRRAGRSVAEIFSGQGEPEFRRLESAALGHAVSGPAAVIATGGGVVLDPANRELLRGRCRVVWLRTSVEDLVDRLGATEGVRPLLAGDLRTTLCAQEAEREALYAEVATCVVDTGALPAVEVARRVVEEVQGG